MDFLQEMNAWAKGDALQGKLMVVAGLLLALVLFFIFKSENTLLKGMWIPVCLLMIITLGYGSVLSYSRPKHAETTTKLYHQKPQEAVKKELDKAKTDSRSYTILKPIWAFLIIASVISFFFIKNDYYKGLSLGLLCLFTAFLLIDTFLHHRLKSYLEFLVNSIH